MSVTAAMRTRLRALVNEATDAVYDDDALDVFIERYPLLDERGEAPYTWDTSTPPAQDVNEVWIATYDLHRAAADIWEEKATAKADLYQFQADGGNFSRHQVFDMYMKMARYHSSRRALGTRTVWQWPPENAAARVVNLMGER